MKAQHLGVNLLLLMTLERTSPSFAQSGNQATELNSDDSFTKITTGSIVIDGGVGFGCAWGDYDGDGFIDLFVCNNSASPTHDFLYHNRGDGTFERVTGVPPVSVIANSAEASWGDYDNDG